MSAVESGPPDTASSTRRKSFRSEKSEASSESAIGPAAGSTAGTLLFLLDGTLHVGRGLRVFRQHVTERRARRFALAERRERLAEPQQCVRRFYGVRIVGGDLEENLGRVVELLALELRLAQP